MSDISLVFLIFGFVAIVVFFLVKNDKGAKTKRQTNHKESYRDITDNAIKDISERWKEYNELFIFKKEVPLSEIIDSFSQVAIIPFEKKYKILMFNPTTNQQDGEMFFNIIFIAIAESGEHSKEDVRIAYEKVLDKYERQ